MAKSSFDPVGLHRLVDDIRIGRGMSWARMSEEAGISASTMTRLSQGRNPDVHGLVAILAWSGLHAGDVLGLSSSDGVDTMTKIRLALRDDDRLTSLHAQAMGDAVQSLYARLAETETSDGG